MKCQQNLLLWLVVRKESAKAEYDVTMDNVPAEETVHEYKNSWNEPVECYAQDDFGLCVKHRERKNNIRTCIIVVIKWIKRLDKEMELHLPVVGITVKDKLILKGFSW